MTPDRWRAITEIFDAALARATADRGAFLAAACKDDPSLRGEVDQLLAAHQDAGLFGDVPFTLTSVPLAAGTVLGPYHINELIGAGGMGEVYRATDTRLGRTVAIKILPARLRISPDLQARFEREARTISQLAHPNICTLYDVGHENRFDFLVMEHLEGETLAERLARRAVPLDQALAIGVDLAAALDHAHRHGIVHRDLTPGNVMLTKSGTKLLDFGLAKLRRPAGSASASSPASHASKTAEGTLIGTLPYMAPEQLEDGEADGRSDIWALGCVLYELVAGRRAFDADNQAGLIAAILDRNPEPLRLVRPLIAPGLEHAIDTCIAKDPDARWQSVADLKRELEWLVRVDQKQQGAGGRSTKVVWWRSAALLMLAAVVTGVAVASVFWFADRTSAAPPSHVTVSIAAAGLTLTGGGIAISPDGRTLVFAARAGDDDVRLYARQLNEWEPRSLKGTEGALNPFFSPDGRWLAFIANGMLKKLQLPDGIPQSLCRIGYIALTRGSWGTDNRIVIGQWPGVLARVPAEGGTLQPLSSSTGSGEHLWPQVLPDGKHVLFTIGDAGRTRIASLALDTGVVDTVLEAASCARYLPTGHLVYESEGQLRVVAFDIDRLLPVGASRVVVDDVVVGQTSTATNLNFDVSATGTIAFVPASTNLARLAWKDRTGHTTPLPLAPRVYSFPSLSGDGRQLSVSVTEWPERYVWAGSVEHEPLTRVGDVTNGCCSLFSKDGTSIVFTSFQNGWANLFKVPADGSGRAERLLTAERHQKPTSLSPDGKRIFFNDVSVTSQMANRDISQMEIDLPGHSAPVLSTPANELEAVLSPDGHWLAYQSDQSGKWEVYVTRFDASGTQRQVSVGGGMGPVWNPRGGELFYQTRTAVMAVRLENGAPVSAPAKLFAYRKSEDARREFDVAPDGQRFLVMEPATLRAEINVIINWFEELKELPR